ncbi:MAG: aminotransferase class I/II-fold pyridoxal phosphate-dependent enzyme [Candidatus Sericytochromatia bacterium]|nr:aminotransferase class I/II-fold pyridoxal phosphate-dependent enzyme [Candidatus Sericytochromatia bacterium]
MRPVENTIKFDIRVADLLAGLGYCLAPGAAYDLGPTLRRIWGSDRPTMVSATLRSGFDLYLQALELPPGSEVLISAITHPDMVAIVRAQGFVPVPVDVDPATMAPDPAALRRAITPRAQVLVVAQLFGGHFDLADVLAVCRQHGLHLIEDCAQTYGGGYRGHPQADISLFSFGPLKTGTALGGAVMAVRDPAVHHRMTAIQAAYPVLPRREFAKRLAKYALLRAISNDARKLGLLFAVLTGLGRDPGAEIRAWTRSLTGAFALSRFRSQLSTPQVRLLARRLAERGATWVSRRRTVGDRLAERLAGSERPGVQVRDHLHWLFPVMVGDPAMTIERLLTGGWLALPGLSNLDTFDPPPDRPEQSPHTARHILARVLILPMHPTMTDADLAGMAAVVTADTAPIAVAPLPANGK